MQILSNVLISTEPNGNVQFAATDLNLSASGVFPAQVKEPGEITLPARTLYDIVRSMPEGMITLKVDGEAVEVSSGRSNFKLLGLPAEDFPSIPEPGDVEFFEVDPGVLADMIDKTAFSISSDETRPHINGAHRFRTDVGLPGRHRRPAGHFACVRHDAGVSRAKLLPLATVAARSLPA